MLIKRLILVGLWLFAASSAFSQTFISQSSNHQTSGIDITVTAPASITDGDTMLAWYGNNSSDMTGVTLTGFTQIDFIDDLTTAANNVWIACKVASSESGSYSFDATGGTSNSTAASITVFRGYDGCTLAITYVKASHYVKLQNDLTPLPQPISTVDNGDRVVIFAHTVSTAGTPPSGIVPSTGYTEHVEVAQNNRTMHVQSKAITSSGTETPDDITLTAAGSGSDTSLLTLALQQPASGGLLLRLRQEGQ